MREAYKKKMRSYQGLSMSESAYELASIFSIVNFSANFFAWEREIYK